MIDLLRYEAELLHSGYHAIAGTDEAGRGPLAGPVVAAAVILHPGQIIPGVTDSKKLSERQRDKLFPLIMAEARAVAVGICDHGEIDGLNILRASLEAMRRAVTSLPLAADFILIDGTFSLALELPQRAIIKGDSLSLSIAAASIIAKVTRDRLMVEYDVLHPGYGFAGHKGYPTADHRAAIARLGPSPLHRKSFKGVKEHLKGATLSVVPERSRREVEG
jgi:ribonuclease HII